MCFFDEKLSDALLVGLPDYEFAVRNTHVYISFGFSFNML
jgi:hypothetical protein